jgi:Histidine kinase-, DNA gyrase B-, and HSP90-like ATPase
MPDFVDITPHVSLLAKVGQSGHSVSDAIAELVDNALDARPPRRPVTVEIELDVGGGAVRVFDDGCGMTGAGLARALVLAESTKDGAAIGRFGLGLKTACSSLGHQFEITSAVEDGHYAHAASYDAASFLADGRWRLPIRRMRKSWPHGTLVEIQSDRLYSTLPGTLHKNLGWTFRHFILDDVLRLTIDGESVKAAQYEVDAENVMPLEGRVAGQVLRGWVGLLQQSSQRGWYGFALIRHRRVVRRHEKLGFQAHPQTARVVGELHLDGFDTNNLKTDFIRETQTWRELESWVSEAIAPIVSASRALAHAGMLDLKIRSRIAAERGRYVDETEGLHIPDDLVVADSSASDAVAVAVGEMHLAHVFVQRGPEASYVEIDSLARDGEADIVMVRTNLGHPAATQVTDRSGWACHNIAEAFATRTSRNADQLHLKSVILAKLLSERPLRRALQESARRIGHTKVAA